MNKLLYNSTISTVKWKPFEDGFPLPAVTVCSGSNMTTNLTLADFVRDCEVIGTPCTEALGDYLEVTMVTLSERRCFTFKTNRNAPLNEKKNGIQMKVKFQPKDITKDKVEVYLHGRTQAYNPFYVLGLDRNIELPLGKTIKVELMVEMSRYLNGHGQACREEADYSFVDCVRFCLEQHLIESGPQCRLEWMLPRDSAPLCTDEEVARNLSMLASDKESTIAREFPECEAQCEPACLLYNYRGVEYSSLVNPKLQKTHSAEFKFKFRDTCYTAIEEVVNYDFWSMIGEVGGTLGFLLGLSLLSILDLIADGVRTLNNWRIRRKRRHARQLVLRAKY
ncbi:uncharacterized protein LOC119101173 [Pollicipes pollicipes]|uniref:uncharacterized protein LOC119101173 n=1 Tax=Pollicipes pollicipes TaxID=41117 RepID=UPI001884D691|nr:uncharacterized protein LOC119101173 [Pollicipes pollicipes]